MTFLVDHPSVLVVVVMFGAACAVVGVLVFNWLEDRRNRKAKP